MRYSDYSTLTKDNFQGDYLVKRTKKTNVDVKVPAHDYVKEIFAKYNGNIPGGLCIQYFNKYLKVIMREIGLNDLITYSYTAALIINGYVDMHFGNLAHAYQDYGVAYCFTSTSLAG